MKKYAKIICLVIAAALMTSLFAGCGNKNNDGQSESFKLNDTGYVYVPTYKTIKLGDVSYMRASCFTGEVLYFLADVVVGQEIGYYGVASNTDIDLRATAEPESYTYDVYETRLFVLDIAAGESKELAYRPPVFEGDYNDGNIYVNALFCDNDGNIFIIEESYRYIFDLPDYFDERTDDKWNYYSGTEYLYDLVSLDSEGEIIARADLAGLVGENTYIYSESVAVSGDGSIYMPSDTGIVAINSKGEKLFDIEVDTEHSWIQYLFTLGNGNVAVSIYDYSEDSGTERMYEIDPGTKTLVEGAMMPYGAYNITGGNDEYDIFWRNSTYFFGYDFNTGESIKLLSWIGCDIDCGNIMGTPVVLENGNIILMTGSYNDSGDSFKTELVTLTKTPESEVTSKKVLTFACAYLFYDLRRQILEFNKTNEEFRIEVINYSEYNNSDDYNAGITKLNTEIIAGNAPDIIYTYELPISLYSSKGLLEDLIPYIEADEELGGMNGLVEPVINAMKTADGELHYVVSKFQIITAAGSASLIGDKTGWNFDEFYEAYSQMPEGADIFEYYMTRDETLRYLNTMCLDGLIDWETGECYFDTDTFKHLLEFANMFPGEYIWDEENYVYEDTYTRIASGKQMLMTASVNDISDIQRYNLAFGGKAALVGYPTEEKNGSAFYIDEGLAISSTCVYKEEAWKFVRNILTAEYQDQNSWSFPTNKESFDKRLSKSMESTFYTDEKTGERTEEPHGYVWVGEESIPFYAPTEAEFQQLSDLINNTTRIYTYDESIFEIIIDSAAPYFAGKKSLDDTAAQIQSRVKLYVNEQK